MAGCETVNSHSHAINESAKGVTYGMPVQYVKLSFTREMRNLASLEEASNELIAARAELKSAKDAFNAAKTQSDDANKLYLAAQRRNVNSDILDEFRVTLGQTELITEKTKNARDEAQNELDKLKNIQIGALGGEIDPAKWNYKKPEDKLVVELLQSVADPNKRFSVTFPHSPLRTDEHNIFINDDGLLQTANIESSDKTGVILTAIAKTIGGINYASPLPSYASQATPTAEANFLSPRYESYTSRPGTYFGSYYDLPERKGNVPFMRDEELIEAIRSLRQVAESTLAEMRKQKFSQSCSDMNALDGVFWSDDDRKRYGAATYETIIDPVDIASVRGFNQKLCQVGSNLRFMSTRPNLPDTQIAMSLGKVLACPTNKYSGDKQECQGLVYRRRHPIQLSVNEVKKSADKKLVKMRKEAHIVNIPNAAPLDYVEDSSSLFSTRSSEMKFSNGVLVEYHVERPSEINEMANAAYEVMLAPFRAVSEIVEIKVDTAKGEQAIATSAYEIEKLRIDAIKNESNLSKTLLDNEKSLLSTTNEIAKVQALQESQLQLAILQGDTSIQNELATQRANAAEVETELFNAQVTAINRVSGLTDAELQNAINILKKRKELLVLQKEIEELAAGDLAD